MRLVYTIINFVILAVVLVIVGRKFLGKKLREHEETVEEGLKKAEQGEEKARSAQLALQEKSEEASAELTAAAREGESIVSREAAAAAEAARESIEKQRAESEERMNTMRLDMLQRVKEDTLKKVSERAKEILSRPEYAAKLRMVEPLVVDQILARAEITPGDAAYLMQHEVLYVTLNSAFPLDESLVERIRGAIDDMLDKIGGKASFWVKNDPKLIGGLRLRIGDTLYDGTVLNYLDNVVPTMDSQDINLETDAEEMLQIIMYGLATLRTTVDEYQWGRVVSVSDGICWLDGLSDIMYGELVEFDCGEQGMILDIEADRIGCVVFGAYEHIEVMDRVRRLNRMAGIPVGSAMLGRVVDPLGNPIDGKGNIRTSHYRSIESAAPGILSRQKVAQPLKTGIKAIDALVPVGKGQRELVIGDRQTGKTALAVDAIINQKGKDVICIYVAIGQKVTTVASIRDRLEKCGAMDYTIIVCADAFKSAPMQYIAPYAGAAMGEYFMYKGKDVLIVYDDLSKHAVAYREISLLLHRPPGREAYPGDIFYLHSRLLERSAKLSDELGGGSMTALPIIETQAGDISSFIPTNVISITDGQIFLETDLFNQGQRPAVNVGLSVSRVGGSAQTDLLKQVSGRLRMELAQYRELQTFSQFGSDLDESTKASLARGERMTAALRQEQYKPLSDGEQALVIFAVSEGAADGIDSSAVGAFEDTLIRRMKAEHPEVMAELETGRKMSDELKSSIILFARSCAEEM